VIELKFDVVSAQAKQNAASPTIVFALDVQADNPVEALVLRVQLRVEPQWRRYDGREQTLLSDLFGTPERWGTTLRALSWADVPVVVTGFDSRTQGAIEVPCTYDFDVAATRYLHALEGGDIPLRFLFSGAVFTYGTNGMSTERVSWSSEAAFRMPVEVWRQALRACYGDDALIRISAKTLEDLHRLRALSGARGWDDLFARLSGAAT
jgi:hypothetical protein